MFTSLFGRILWVNFKSNSRYYSGVLCLAWKLLSVGPVTNFSKNHFCGKYIPSSRGQKKVDSSANARHIDWHMWKVPSDFTHYTVINVVTYKCFLQHFPRKTAEWTCFSIAVPMWKLKTSTVRISWNHCEIGRLFAYYSLILLSVFRSVQNIKNVRARECEHGNYWCPLADFLVGSQMGCKSI